MNMSRQESVSRSDTQAETRPNELRPYYWILPLVPLTLYLHSVITQPQAFTPTRLITLTVLTIAHTTLHVMAPFFVARRKWLIPYVVVQGALAFSMAMMLSSLMYVYALYLAIAGQAAGLFDDVRPATITVLAYVLLSGVNFVLRMGWNNIAMYLIWAVPMTFFILVYVSLFIRQTNARRETQSLLADLETAHRQLAEYAVQVESLTLTTERERMARELHDTLAQGLAGLILQLEAADEHLAGNQYDRVQKIITQAMSRARTALADARRVIDDLRSNDTKLDVEAIVRAETERFTSATGIPCKLDIEITSKIPEPLAEHMLKIVSEGLTNIARHARAKNASLRLEAHSDLLEMEIKDNGCGFDSGGQIKSGHYGLVGMRERARLAGGTLEIHSIPGEGTTLRLRLPL
jgi:NarL family two-component system sensor histidine kinase YdfH